MSTYSAEEHPCGKVNERESLSLLELMTKQGCAESLSLQEKHFFSGSSRAVTHSRKCPKVYRESSVNIFGSIIINLKLEHLFNFDKIARISITLSGQSVLTEVDRVGNNKYDANVYKSWKPFVGRYDLEVAE